MIKTKKHTKEIEIQKETGKQRYINKINTNANKKVNNEKKEKKQND